MKKAFIFDRDGTINIDKNYLYKIEDFEFIQGVPMVLKELRQKGYLLILITNQSGIARGYYSVNDMEKLHQYIQEKLAIHNAQFDKIYYCPHHPEGIVPEYSIRCECRKPGKALFERAISEYDIDVEKSYAVGDKDRDLLPAKMLGINCIKLSSEKDANWKTVTSFDRLIEII